MYRKSTRLDSESLLSNRKFQSEKSEGVGHPEHNSPIILERKQISQI